MRRLIGRAIYALSAAVGILAFVYPFFRETQATASLSIAHGQDAPLVTTALVGLSLIALLFLLLFLLLPLTSACWSCGEEAEAEEEISFGLPPRTSSAGTTAAADVL